MLNSQKRVLTRVASSKLSLSALRVSFKNSKGGLKPVLDAAAFEVVELRNAGVDTEVDELDPWADCGCSVLELERRPSQFANEELSRFVAIVWRNDWAPSRSTVSGPKRRTNLKSATRQTEISG